MRSADSFSWSPEAVEALKTMHGNGKSFTEIAKALSVQFKTPISRSAAIGKAQRSGLCGTKEDARQKQLKRGAARRLELGIIQRAPRPLRAPPVAKGAPNPIGANSSRVYVLPKALSASEREAMLDAIATEPKTMLDPAWGGCRWPLHRTTDDGDALFCCNARQQKAVYCEGHTPFATQKARTPEQIAADAKTWAKNVERSGANLKATRHFNTPIAVAS